MDADWYDLSTKAVGFVWSLIGLACVFLGLVYANSPTANDTFFLHPDASVMLVYAGNIVLIGGLSLAFLVDGVIRKRDKASIAGYALFVVGSFVILFGVLSLSKPDSVLYPRLNSSASLVLSGIGFATVVSGMIFLYYPEPVNYTISLLKSGVVELVPVVGAVAVFAGALAVVLYLSQFVLTRLTATILVVLLATAVAIYLLRGTALETGEQIGVVVLIVAFALAGSISFAGFVFTPSYDNTTMVVGGSEPGCPGGETVSFNEEEFSLENGTLGNYTEREVKEDILSKLDTEDANLEKKYREIESFRNKLDKSLEEVSSNKTNKTGVGTSLDLNEREIRKLRAAFEDAVVAEVTSYHYGQSDVRVERLPLSTNVNEALRILEEEYNVENPKVVDEKPRHIRFFGKSIDIEERYNPDRYYVIDGNPKDFDYEGTHLLIVRGGLNTRLVRFWVGDC